MSYPDTPTPNIPTLYTLDDVADRLHLSRWSLNRMIRLGHINAVSIGTHRYITETELLAITTGGAK